MKKYDTLLKIIIIALCIGSAFFIQSVGDDILVMHSNNTCRQIYLRADEILKKEADERERIGMQSDIAISRVLDQINANMSEEYWLFETQRKTKGPLSLDIYVDDIENIEHIVVVPLDKVAFVNEKGDEYYFIYITEYNVLNGNIKELAATEGRYLDSWDNFQTTLNEMERIRKCTLNYVKTIENYEWPQAKQPRYKLEDLQSTKIYQDFELCINKQFYFPTGAEIYLGLWNGYSNRVRLMYRTLGSDEKIHYYSTEMNLDGQRCNFVNEVTEEIYERFKLISVKMM